MINLKHKVNRRPVLFREILQSFYFRVPVKIVQKAQSFGGVNSIGLFVLLINKSHRIKRRSSGGVKMSFIRGRFFRLHIDCLLYTSDAADEEDSVDLGGRRIIKK